MDALETLRAAEQLGRGMDEPQRQRIGREAFAEVMGMPQLSGLVECSVCGLLDNTDPCGDH